MADGFIVTAVSVVLFFFLDFSPIVYPVWAGAYYWLFTGTKGQTPGKMALGIRVVERGGRSPGLWRAAVREVLGKSGLAFFPVAPAVVAGFGAILIFVFRDDIDWSNLPGEVVLYTMLGLFAWLVGLLGFLWMVWDHRKQGWHDKLARTYVLKGGRSER